MIIMKSIEHYCYEASFISGCSGW